MPVRTAPYSTGSTIRKPMSTDSDDPLTQTSARMIKLATGVALISCITGASSASAQSERSAATARSTLLPAPSRKPSRMRPVLNTARCQKSACGKSSIRVANACMGDTRKTSCPMAMAAPCQTASQNKTERSCFLRLVFCFFMGFSPFSYL